MIKKAKGKQPTYFDNPQVDKLLAIVMALVGEVSVLRDRFDTLERLAEAKGILSVEEIEKYQPDEQAVQQREQWRADYIARVLRVLEEEIESLDRG